MRHPGSAGFVEALSKTLELDELRDNVKNEWEGNMARSFDQKAKSWEALPSSIRTDHAHDLTVAMLLEWTAEESDVRPLYVIRVLRALRLVLVLCIL